MNTNLLYAIYEECQMTEQPLNCADIEYLSPHPEALEDVLWELNHGVLPRIP